MYVCMYVFIYRGEKGGRKRGGETSMCGCLLCAPSWGPATQACALLTRNPSGDPLVCRLVLSPLSHTSQGPLSKYLYICLNISSGSLFSSGTPKTNTSVLYPLSLRASFDWFSSDLSSCSLVISSALFNLPCRQCIEFLIPVIVGFSSVIEIGFRNCF